jgi:hypothetical protein
MANGGPNKRVTYLFDYFDYNLFGIKLVNALTDGRCARTRSRFLKYILVNLFNLFSNEMYNL